MESPTLDVLALVVTPLGSGAVNADIGGCLNWREQI